MFNVEKKPLQPVESNFSCRSFSSFCSYSSTFTHCVTKCELGMGRERDWEMETGRQSVCGRSYHGGQAAYDLLNWQSVCAGH